LAKFARLPTEEKRQEMWAQDAIRVEQEKKRSWLPKMPSDITWENGSAAAVYPQTDIRNQRFKLFPQMKAGPWVVTSAVRSVPCILGQKVVQRYFSHESPGAAPDTRYIEIDVDVGSSLVAANIVGVCRGYAQKFMCHIALVLQAETEQELPERLLGILGMRDMNVDLYRYNLRDYEDWED
jgi:hypothetical protein